MKLSERNKMYYPRHAKYFIYCIRPHCFNLLTWSIPVVSMRGSRKFCQRKSNFDGFFFSFFFFFFFFFFFLVDEEREDPIPQYKRSIIGPPAKHHLNGVSLACWWWLNIKCWLDSFQIFRGSGPVLPENPTFLHLLDFSDPCPPPPPPTRPGSTHG